MNFLVFSTHRVASYLSSRVLSSIFLPYTPPWALTLSKYALVPMFIWMPNWAAGPEKAADWPSTIDLAVIPGVCAMAPSGTAQTISEAIKNLVFKANPSLRYGVRSSTCSLQGAADFDRPAPKRMRLLRLAARHLQCPYPNRNIGLRRLRRPVRRLLGDE